LALAALGVVGCSAGHSTAASPSPVLSHPVHGVAPVANPTKQVAALPECRPGRLSATGFFVPAGAGADLYRIKLIDHGRSCRLRGRPHRLFGVSPTGRQRLSPGRMARGQAIAFSGGKRGPLTARRAGQVVLATGIGCPSAQRHMTSSRPEFASLLLGVDGGLVHVRFGSGPEPVDRGFSLWCGAAMTGFYAWPSTASH
jgi:hypothetical protein